MPTELTMLVWVAVLTALLWLPYVLAKIISSGAIETLTYKADSNPLPLWAERAKKAHYNSVENLVIFAVLVLTAHLLQISNEATITSSVAYFWLRAAYYPLYILNIPFGRTLTFAGAWFAQACIAYQILFIGVG